MCANQRRQYRAAYQQGVTLVELVIAIVLLALAMTGLSQFLFPQIASSATPYYQTRAAALGQAVMSEILTRQFDQRSDPFSIERCNPSASEAALRCTAPNALKADSGETAANTNSFNDVDDYNVTSPQGSCWGDNSLCQGQVDGPITALLPGSPANEYANFAVTIRVVYDGQRNGSVQTQQSNHKRVMVEVLTSQYGNYQFTAYRSNY
uniref:type IV pilus modification PilV family protein n=1 Tax=Thaumasiovibrio occultus TaxID=1891184 RepID=UPI00131D3CD0|nr:prepilin-type N-terminal cleavage/methylation domain-containing protein [Thaumasiovibrio occultus]